MDRSWIEIQAWFLVIISGLLVQKTWHPQGAAEL